MSLWDFLVIIYLSISYQSKCFLLRQWGLAPAVAEPRGHLHIWIKHWLKVHKANLFNSFSLKKQTDVWIKYTYPLQLRPFP